MHFPLAGKKAPLCKGGRRVKKTCRWHVFSADLGGYAAAASGRFPPYSLAVNPFVSASRCHLSCARPSVSTGVPLHKGGVGALYLTEMRAFIARRGEGTPPYGVMRSPFL